MTNTPLLADPSEALRTAYIDGDYRWTLTRAWGKRSYLVFIMLNPSTADALRDDPTIRRCVSFAKREGYGAMKVLNLYSYRTPKPAELWAAEKRGVNIIGHRTNGLLREALTNDAVVAAWGANARPDRVQWLMSQPHADRLQCLGTTKDGHPRHPLYVRSDTPLQPYQRDRDALRGES